MWFGATRNPLKISSRQWLFTFFVGACAFGGSGVVNPSWSQAQPASPKAESVSGKFERVAAHLEFFDLGAFLYHRPNLSFTPVDAGAGKRYFELLNQVLDPEVSVADIASLRHHADAKVRTLALAALFQRNAPHLLPLIVELTSDTNPTFSTYEAVSRAWWPGQAPIVPPEKKQRVSEVANAMVNFYLERAGFHHRIAGSGDKTGFAPYWAQRKERTCSASWFAVELARASRGTSPTQPQYRADIHALKTRIDALPAADRDWTLLYLNGDEGSDVLASESELIAAAKRRGADALLSALRGKIPSDDPDLQRRGNNDWPYQRLMRWILARAPLLLRPEMADDLLACERWERDYRSHNSSNPLIIASWPVAAAQLQPQRAREILKAAWSRFDGEYDGDHRVSLMAALAAVGDARDFEFLSTWYFAPAPAKYDGSVNQGKQSEFFSRLPHQGASQATRQMVARLINDQRFDTAKFWAIKEAAELVNAWSPSSIFDIQKLYEAGWIGDPTRPTALAAIAAARDALRQTSTKWGQ
jgi:hypothetical protein